MADRKIRSWTVTDIDQPDGPMLRIERRGRGSLLMIYNPDMDPDVLMEFATTRVLEAELADAERDGKDTSRLQREYDSHVTESRINQQRRSEDRLRAEQREQ